ncbi:MAG: glucose-6-phosphate isomerase, partial [Bacteroidia bacterium]|nr:glucose-6-phosphate isomerase [Bacteroidia bacterium]
MSLKSINPTQTKSWKKLRNHFNEIKDVHMKDLFKEDSDLGRDFSIKWEDNYVDYSKNRITKKTMDLLFDLAKEIDLKDAMNKYFGGDIINKTEHRAVLHTALR